MPRWLPDSFDPAAHNARVRSMRSQVREADNLHRITPTPADNAPPSAGRSPAAASVGTIPVLTMDGVRDPDLKRASRSPAVVLPWPPSGNHAVKHTTAGAHYLRPEVAQYRRHVASLCVRLKPVVGRYRLHVHLSPPDARQRDMDNALKTINDALVRCGWLCDDSMVYMRELHVTVDDARQGSAIVRAEVLDGPRGAA